MINNFLRRIDWQLAIPVLILLAISFTTLFSINIIFFRNQLIFSVISLIIFFLISQIDIDMLSIYKKQIYFGSLFLLFVLLIIGGASRGAVRWLGVFGFGVQFSEILKPFFIVVLASFLTQEKNISFKTFIKVFLFLFPVAFLIYRQPDLGSAIIYILVTLVTLSIYGFPLWWFGVGLGGLFGALPVLWKFLHDYQRQRILTFFHFVNDPLGNSYNAIQAIIAVGSGMLFGKGLGLGTQSALKFLPEKQTDFIFATISEDLGMIGGVIIIIVFLFILYRIFIIFTETDSLFERVIVAASFSLIFIQFFINIGMNIGILPIVGVTLPFVSYGGSSLVSSVCVLAIVSQISTKTKTKRVLEIK